MSRSIRKPYVVDGYGSKWKRFAKANHNRILRRKLKNPEYEIADGGAHKTHAHGLNPWDICDYKWYEPKTRKSYSPWWSEEEQLDCHKKLCRK